MANADIMLDTWVVCRDGPVYCARVIFALTFPDMAACFVGREEEDVIRVILPDVTREEISNIIETVINGQVSSVHYTY